MLQSSVGNYRVIIDNWWLFFVGSSLQVIPFKLHKVIWSIKNIDQSSLKKSSLKKSSINLWLRVKSSTYRCWDLSFIRWPTGARSEEAHHLHVCRNIMTCQLRDFELFGCAGSFLLALCCQKQMEAETMFTLVSQLWYADGKFTENEWCSSLAELR